MRSSLIRLKGRLGVALAVILVGGCTTLTAEYGRPLPESWSSLREGVADVGSAVAELGPPTRLSALPEGMVMLYEYVLIGERQLGINLEFLELEILKMSMGRARANREALVLVFDSGGMLRAMQHRAWEEDVGRGGSLQLFFVMLPTVDSSHLRALPEQHTWGRAALDPLPVTLNSAQSVAVGTHGLELRGTPTWAGQRTLEMSTPQRRR